VTSFGFPLIPVVDGSILLIDSLWEGACGAVVCGVKPWGYLFRSVDMHGVTHQWIYQPMCPSVNQIGSLEVYTTCIDFVDRIVCEAELQVLNVRYGWWVQVRFSVLGCHQSDLESHVWWVC
jgi:hypothetical protein